MTSQDEPSTDSMFEAALDSLDWPIIVHGATAIIFANQAACRVLRAPDASALIGSDIISIVHPDGLEAGNERRRLVLEHGQVMRDVPVKLRAVDGTTMYARVNGKRIAWSGSTAILIAATYISSE